MAPNNPKVRRLWASIRQKLAQRRASEQFAGEPESLKQIRRGRRISQVTLAARMGASQGDLSRLERRSDLLISTLARYVAALGGSLEVSVRFPGLLIRIDLPGATGPATVDASSVAGHD